jgi:hypothetical protein
MYLKLHMIDPVRPRQLGCPSLLGRDSRVRVKKRKRADKKTAQLFLSLCPFWMNFVQKFEMLFAKKVFLNLIQFYHKYKDGRNNTSTSWTFHKLFDEAAEKDLLLFGFKARKNIPGSYIAYHKVASFVTRLVYMHTQNDNL